MGTRTLFLPLLLLAALADCDCGKNNQTTIDSTLEALVPPDAIMLAGAQMDAIRATPLYQRLAAGRSGALLDELARQTGVDPRHDMRELLIASDGKGIIFTARGDFGHSDFSGFTKQSYKGAAVYLRDPNAAVAVIDSSTAIAGGLPHVKAAVDRYRSGDRGRPAGLLARAGQIPRANQVWAVANGFENLLFSVPDGGIAANVAPILESMGNTTFAADLRSGFNGYLTGTCRTEQEAKNMGDTLRGLISLARLGARRTTLLQLLDGIKLDQHGQVVTLTLDVTPDVINDALNQLR